MKEDLAAPTTTTVNVSTMAAMTATVKRLAKTDDIGGAYLIASMAESEVIFYMRLGNVMTAILVRIDLTFAVYATEDGTSMVQLDKPLHGCVGAAHLWYPMLRGSAYSFEANQAEPFVFNKLIAA